MKTKNQKKNQKRAYKVNMYGKTIVIGGEKAGRFYSSGITYRKAHKNALETDRKGIRRQFTAVIIPILWFLLIATGCTGIAELNQTTSTPLTAEPMKVEKAEAQEFPKEYESHDIPADYVDPDLFDKYFGENANVMRAVCQAESGLNPNAIGDGHLTFWQDGKLYGMSVGLCQIRILPGRNITVEQMQDPEQNILFAKKLFDTKQGLKHWTMYTNGKYLKYFK